MKHPLSLLLTAILCATASAQTIKTLGFNITNGQVVANTGTNVLTFTNNVRITEQADSTSFTFWGMQGWGAAVSLEERLLRDGETAAFQWGALENTSLVPLNFGDPSSAATTRANLGFSTNLNTLWTATNASNARSAVALGATWLTNTNVTNFRTEIGLGADNIATFKGIEVTTSATNADLFIGDGGDIVGDGDLFIGAGALIFQSALEFSSNSIAAATRTNLLLGLPALTNTSNVTIMRALSGSTNTNHPYSGSYQISVPGGEVNLVFSNGILQDITQ